MTDAVPRFLVEAFYKAYLDRDVERVAEFLADDVEWSISGPVDLLHFCGMRRGKAAVLDVITRQFPELFRFRRLSDDALLIDGDRVAKLSRFTAGRNDSNRMISYRVAYFLRFRDGKVTEFTAIIDSFDAVEQVLGHAIALPAADAAGQDNLIML
jgi:ketosteroid isomerase-like protein